MLKKHYQCRNSRSQLPRYLTAFIDVSACNVYRARTNSLDSHRVGIEVYGGVGNSVSLEHHPEDHFGLDLCF